MATKWVVQMAAPQAMPESTIQPGRDCAEILTARSKSRMVMAAPATQTIAAMTTKE